MTEKFATACVLSYDRPQFLQEMLGTMVAYAGHPLEVIVHDDGSTNPEVRPYLHRMVEQGRISTLIENPPGHNQGQGVALNRMFHMAQGDPIIKLDQDLIFHNDWLKKAIGILDSNWENARENGGHDEPTIGALGLFRYPVEPVRYEDMFIKDWPGSGWEEHEDFVGSAMVIPRPVWEQYGPFDHHSDAFAEDREFKMKIKEDGLRLALPREGDLVTNQGFGVGPSTVVVDHGKVAQIHKGPKVYSSLASETRR